MLEFAAAGILLRQIRGQGDGHMPDLVGTQEQLQMRFCGFEYRFFQIAICFFQAKFHVIAGINERLETAQAGNLLQHRIQGQGWDPDGFAVLREHRNVIGSAVVDSILTDGKSEIQMQVQELIAEGLAEYDIGLALTDVKIQDAEPPTEAVVEAFRNVETAKQGAETAVNEALAYQNAQLPLAQAQADKLLQNAEYVRQNRVNEARQQVAMFEAMYSEYVLNPQITRVRMYYEAIREAFPNARIYIDATDGSVQKLLPLETIVGQ